MATPVKKKKVVVLAEAPTLSNSRYLMDFNDPATLPKELKDIEAAYKKKSRLAEDSFLRYIANNTGDILKVAVDAGGGTYEKPSYKANNIVDEITNTIKSGSDSIGIANKLIAKYPKLDFNKIKRLANHANDYNVKEKDTRDTYQSFYTHPANPYETKMDSTFIKEGNNIKTFYKNNPNVSVDVLPFYDNFNDLKPKLDSLDVNDDIAIFGHSGGKLGGIRNKLLADELKENKANNLYIGSCNFQNRANDFEDTNKNVYYRGTGPWQGFNPRATSFINGMYSRTKDKLGKDTTVTPKEGVDYNVIKDPSEQYMNNNKFALGGIDPISLISSGLSLATNAYAAVENKLAAKAAGSFNKNLSLKQRVAADGAMLNDFNQSGANVEFFAKGGAFKLNRRTRGNVSKFKRISKDVFETQGEKHKDGGTKVGDSELERGELVKFDPETNSLRILSDRPDTLGYSPSDKISKVNASDEVISQLFDAEFNKQEMVKADMGTNRNTKKFYGGGTNGLPFNPNSSRTDFIANAGFDINLDNYVDPSKPMIAKKAQVDKPYLGTYDLSLASKATKDAKSKISTMNSPTGANGSVDGLDINILPYVMDNVSNLITTLNTPKVQKPVLTPDAKLNTDINIDPMVSNIRSNERAGIRAVNNNIGDSNVATALGISVGNKATADINAVKADEQNKENELLNKEVALNVNNRMFNTQLANEYQDKNLRRSLGINESINENINNLSRDLIDIQNKKAFDRQDRAKFALELSKDSKGVLADVILSTDTFDRYLSDDMVDLSKLHPDTAKAIAAKRAKLAMSNGSNSIRK